MRPPRSPREPRRFLQPKTAQSKYVHRLAPRVLRVHMLGHFEVAGMLVYQPIPAVPQGFPGKVGKLKLLSQVQRLGRAGLLAKAAKDAAQHVDLVLVRVTLSWRMWTLRVVLLRHHGDGRRRARDLTQLAADA